MDKTTFPFRLYNVLETVSDTDEASVISWTPNGTTFRIHDLDRFKTHILPKYFPKQSQYKSFRRQLQYYGFFTLGWNHFGHRIFVRGKEELLFRIKHKKVQPEKKKTAMDILASRAADAKPLNDISDLRTQDLLKQDPTLEALQRAVSAEIDASRLGIDSLRSSSARAQPPLGTFNKPVPTASVTPPRVPVLTDQYFSSFEERTENGAKQLLAMLDLALPKTTQYNIMPSYPSLEQQLQRLQRENDLKQVNQALLMKARSDSDFIRLARFQLGL